MPDSSAAPVMVNPAARAKATRAWVGERLGCSEGVSSSVCIVTVPTMKLAWWVAELAGWIGHLYLFSVA